MDARDHAFPIVNICLAKEAGGRIPGTIVPIEQPPPIGNMGHHDPDRLSQRAGKMSDTGIDRNDEIQLRIKRRRVGKILKFIGQL